ncbi:alpha/beta hydrolase [Agrobacterium tumefaciens]|uniref:alpha/beta fold hydrolase n=1 Tax=Agrobacterium fabrum TaxID=1176649 RepID=UPI0015746E72|nr:alpha/beta hydrolase [Agrobacterium fabrum]NTE84563.1 alpha/beta hydrolase [Agrobacterium tumefaciens]
MTVLNFTVIGSGPNKVIAAHSWLADHRTYQPSFPYLDTDTYTFVFPDFRGYGRSAGIGGEYSNREMGRDLVAVADHLEWSDFHLVGHSMGGQAAHWLSGQPRIQERIRSLLLVCAVPARGFPLDEQGAAFFGAAAGSTEVRGKISSAVTGGRLGPGFENYMARLSEEGVSGEALSAYLAAWTQEDLSQEVSRYDGPVRIYVGQFDPVLTAELWQQIIPAAFPQASLDTIPGAAHYPAQETPAYFANLLNALSREGSAG